MKRLTQLVFILTLTALAIILTATMYAERFDPGPAQPIPFSHRIHARNKQISCFFCHPHAWNSSNAGIPPVDKCLLCHNVIATNFAPIRKISTYNARKKGIPWVRVVDLPDHVHFSHQAHIAGGQDCGECHGNVKAMDRVKLAKTIDMNLCITCHKKNKISVDCYLCHY